MLIDKKVIITRDSQDSSPFKDQLEAIGASVYELPTIQIVRKKLSLEDKETLKKISSYDWLIFTSQHAALFLKEYLEEFGVKKEEFSVPKIAAIGSRTARCLEELGLKVSLISKQFTSQNLSRELSEVAGKRILIPCSEISLPELADNLRQRGALVSEIPLYTTLSVQEIDPLFCDLLSTNQISYLTFTSPSCTNGFLKRIKDSMMLEKALQLPTICIGPRTAEAAKALGFAQIITANPFTTEGIIKKIQELTSPSYALS